MIKNIIVVISALFLASSLYADCQDERFDINVKDQISLKNAILSIVDECGYSLSIEGDQSEQRFANAKLSFVSLKGVKADEAIASLTSRANLHHRIENNTVVISYMDTKVFKIDYINNTRTGSSSSDVKIGGSSGASSSSSSTDSSTGNSSTTIKTEEQFDFWTTLQDELYSILARPEDGAVAITKESIVVNPRSGLVTVTGTARQLDRVTRYLENTLRSLKKQVMIDVQIIAVDNEGDKATGIDWAKFPLFTADGTVSYGQAGTLRNFDFRGGAVNVSAGSNIDFSLKGFLNFLKTQGDTKALSNPKVLSMNNQPTLISVGENINYLILSSTVLSGGGSGSATQETEPQDIFVGVLLDITPQIDDDGYITLRINPSISELKYAEDNQRQLTPRTIAPDTISRRISSVVRAKDQDVIILGGLISSFDRVEHSKLPLLGDIPFLGKLFGATRSTKLNREIVFVLTPQIIENGSEITLKDLGYQSKTADLIKPNLRVEMPKIKEIE